MMMGMEISDAKTQQSLKGAHSTQQHTNRAPEVAPDGGGQEVKVPATLVGSERQKGNLVGQSAGYGWVENRVKSPTVTQERPRVPGQGASS